MSRSTEELSNTERYGPHLRIFESIAFESIIPKCPQCNSSLRVEHSDEISASCPVPTVDMLIECSNRDCGYEIRAEYLIGQNGPSLKSFGCRTVHSSGSDLIPPARWPEPVRQREVSEESRARRSINLVAEP